MILSLGRHHRMVDFGSWDRVFISDGHGLYPSNAADGFSDSWFRAQYGESAGRLKPTMRRVHTGNERLFADFAGHTTEVIDRASGEINRAEIFVAVLGASSFMDAEAIWSPPLPDWSGARVNALSALGGAPRQIVSDNLKAGMTKACFHELTLWVSMHSLATSRNR